MINKEITEEYKAAFIEFAIHCSLKHHGCTMVELTSGLSHNMCIESPDLTDDECREVCEKAKLKYKDVRAAFPRTPDDSNVIQFRNI